jgi:mannose-1-phosphate guanylyltransferase/mannose-6-phosphate isomerase
MLFPVIMCGGGGSRLWPASTAMRPKQFLPLVGDQSIFQTTALRVAGMGDVARLVIIAGQDHADIIEAQLARIGLRGVLLLEPTARDSGPAIAAAAAYIQEQDSNGVAVVVASDHHLPDAASFQEAARSAARLAMDGRIVAFGVRPRSPSTAYGYISLGSPRGEAFDVRSFVEKPGLEVATAYVEAGHLWNSGNFVATAATLLEAFDMHAPGVGKAAREAVMEARRGSGRVRLSNHFNDAPKIAFDHAVMEKTDRASVLPVGFDWSDLGAWSAVHAVLPVDGEGNAISGEAVTINTAACLIRSDGPLVATIGVSNLAVIAENGSVLVCALDSDQLVRTVANHPLAVERATATVKVGAEAAVERVSIWLDRWLRGSALPVWWALGADHDGWGFHETLGLRDAAATAPGRRVRVQARQVYVYAKAGRRGWPGPWRAAVAVGLDALEKFFRRSDGLYRRLVDPRGAPLDESAELYDQAFVLLALAEAVKASANPARPIAPGLAVHDLIGRAEALRTAIQCFRHPGGGFREAGPHPFQANCHMHLFEACQAWLGVESVDEQPWRALAEEIGNLAASRFVSADGRVLHEFFDHDWAALPTSAGGYVDPGHQFEWAWLLARWRGLGGTADRELIHALYAAGRAGRDPDRGVVVNRMSEGFDILDGGARLWPQTECLRAAMMMWRVEGREEFAEDAVIAADALGRYLDTPIPGLWRDVQAGNGTFVDQAAPASSLYHLVGFLRPSAESNP